MYDYATLVVTVSSAVDLSFQSMHINFNDKSINKVIYATNEEDGALRVTREKPEEYEVLVFIGQMNREVVQLKDIVLRKTRR